MTQELFLLLFILSYIFIAVMTHTICDVLNVDDEMDSYITCFWIIALPIFLIYCAQRLLHAIAFKLYSIISSCLLIKNNDEFSNFNSIFNLIINLDVEKFTLYDKTKICIKYNQKSWILFNIKNNVINIELNNDINYVICNIGKLKCYYKKLYTKYNSIINYNKNKEFNKIKDKLVKL